MDDFQAFLCCAPRLLEIDALQKEVRDEMVAAVARISQVVRLDTSAESEPDEVDCRCDWLCPERDLLHAHIRFGFAGSVSIEKTAGELREAVALAIMVEDWT